MRTVTIPRTFLRAALLPALLLLAGCGNRQTQVQVADQGQILRLGNGSEPQELDPHIVTGVPEHHIIMALLEGLVTQDPKDLHPLPGMAEKWEISTDGRVYTFHLRANARWSNGDPVTAQDFVGSFRRILTPALASEYSYMLYPLEKGEAFNKGELKDFGQVGAKAIDSKTLQITLHSPTPYFLPLLCHPAWFPVHLATVEKHGPVFERGSRWTRPENFVGNGPFRLKSWELNKVIEVEKNETYWNASQVKLRGIQFLPIESEDTEERAFRSGQLHVINQLSGPKIDSYRAQSPELLRIDPYLGTYFYMLNVTNAPLKDKRVRRALAMAIDRGSLVTNVLRGGQLPAYAFTPPGTAGYTATASIPYDLAAARKLLADAGYPGGRGLAPVEILYNTLEMHKTIAETIQQMWKVNLGIEVRLRNEEWKVYLDSKRQRQFEVARYGWIGDYVDPNTFLDMWVTDGGNNDTGWSNPEYDRLIREAGRTGDNAKRFEFFRQAEAILLDECPIIPIYFYTHPFLISKSVKGWYPTILNVHPYQYVSLE